MAKILIIDDSRFARLKLSENIKEGGFDISEAADGEEGFKRVLEEKPDIIICDLLMPVMDGFGFLDLLKREGLNIPVLILTSDIQNKTREKALEKGAIGLINKPPKYTEVIKQLQEILREQTC